MGGQGDPAGATTASRATSATRSPTAPHVAWCRAGARDRSPYTKARLAGRPIRLGCPCTRRVANQRSAESCEGIDNDGDAHSAWRRTTDLATTCFARAPLGALALLRALAPATGSRRYRRT